MSVDTYNDYYQLCYTSDTSPANEKDYNCSVDDIFPYECYLSSPKSNHRHIYDDQQDMDADKENIYADEPCPVSPGGVLYSDLNAMKTMLRSSYTEKLKNNNLNKEKNFDKQFVEEAVSCLESLLSNREEETHFKFPDITAKTSESFSEPHFQFPDMTAKTSENFSDKLSSSSSDSAFSNSSLTETLNIDGMNSELDNKKSRIENDFLIDSVLLSPDEQNISDANKIDYNAMNMDCGINSPDDDSSSSGISSQSHSPSSSLNLLHSPPCLPETNLPPGFLEAPSPLLSTCKSNKLNIEIDRLKNMTIKYSPEITKRHSMPKIITDIMCDDINLLETKSKSGSCNTNNRPSTPNGRKSPFFDLFKSKRNIDHRAKKNSKSGLCGVSRSNSMLCNFKKGQAAAIRNSSKYINLMEKHDSENRLDDDVVNNEMKLQQASPFVRTIFQYVESTSVEDIFSSSNFSMNDNNSVPVFSSGGMRNLQESKFNSLSRKIKKNGGIVRTVDRGQHEPTLVSSGRRIPENADFYISIIAYLDRIRKAKGVSLRRRPRQRRHKSDPVDSISIFLNEQNSEKNQLKLKHNSSSETIHDVGQTNLSPAVSKTNNAGALSTRFSDLEMNSESKHFKSPFSNSDSAIHHQFSLCEDSGDHRRGFSRKSRSLRNISSLVTRKKSFLSSKQNSFETNRTSVYDDNNENKETPNSDIDGQSEKFQLARRNLFPDVQKNSSENSSRRSSLLSENFDIQRLLPHRRSVFSENFDTSWRHSLSTSTPSEIQNMLDTQELSPENRQLLTDLLLLQLTQMGPSGNDQGADVSENGNASSTDDVNSNSTDGLPKHKSVASIQETTSLPLSDQSEVHSVNSYHSAEIIYPDAKLNNHTREKEFVKQNRPRKLFGSMRKNKTKLLDWEQVQYMNGGYDDSSMSRKGKGVDTKIHPNNPKVKRFSVIRSIFEPITSPKGKKPWKLDRMKGRTSMKKNPAYKSNCEDDDDVLKSNDVCAKRDLELKSPINTDIGMKGTEMKIPCNDPNRKQSGEFHNQDISTIRGVENQLPCNKNTEQPEQCIMDNERTFRTCEKNFHSKLFQKSRSTNSINDTSKLIQCHRISLSRSVDDIYELKKCTRLAAALFQDVNDSGILHGSSCVVKTTKCRSPRKDVIEVYIGDGVDKREGKGVVDVEEVTSSDPNLSWSTKVGYLGEFCDQCHASSQDVENSRIVVEVPHHLMPPEIASKSPNPSPNIRRKGLLKKSPCIIQHSLNRGDSREKEHAFNSADSGLSLSDETDYPQLCCEKDIPNFCIIKEPKHTLTVNLKKPLASNENGCRNGTLPRTESIHKTEIYHHVDKLKLSKDNNDTLPHVIKFTRSRSNGSDAVCKKDTDPVVAIRQREYSSCSSGCSNTRTRTLKHQNNVEFNNFSLSTVRKDNNEVELEFKTPSNTVSVGELVPCKEPSPSHDVHECGDERDPEANTSGEVHLTRKPSVIWAIVKKMEVSLVIQRDYGDPDIIKIEDFNVRRVNTYKDVEELAVDTFTKHVQLLDKQHLDLDTYDIKYLQMADHRVPLGSPFDLSLVKIEDSFLPCRLCMKGKESWSLASLSYESLIPKSYLEKYVSLILSHHHGIFFGPSGTGKSYLAERISNLVNYRMNEGTIPPIIMKNATPERWKSLLSNLRTEKKEKPFVIILDGFSQRFIESDIDIGDIVKVCEEMEPKPYIICTLTVTPNTQVPPKWQLNFKWIWLSNHEEPVDGLLQRYLRRKFIQFGNQHLQREFFRIADWLTTVWRHINTFLKKFTSSDCSIGPTMFYECPSDILEAEEWFVDLWNYSITPYIISTVKQGLKVHGARAEWEDPTAYILKSYPWVSEKMKRKMKLKRICMEDVDYPLHRHSEEEKQRLLDFLRQLEVMMFAKVDPGQQTLSKGYTMESSL